MYARIQAKEEKQTELFQAAMDLMAHSPVHRLVTCEFVPGVGVNLYRPGDQPGWAAALGSASGEAVWPLFPDEDFPMSDREALENEEPLPVVEFNPGGSVRFRLSTRASPATLALTSCALKILRKARTAGSVCLLGEDWSGEQPEESPRPSRLL